MTQHEFNNALMVAQPGAKISYYMGSLMADRIRGKDDMAIHALGTAAWQAYEKGHCLLVQKRFGTRGMNMFEYIAIKLPPPKPIRRRFAMKETFNV